jgi:hypothetical protein
MLKYFSIFLVSLACLSLTCSKGGGIVREVGSSWVREFVGSGVRGVVSGYLYI